MEPLEEQDDDKDENYQFVNEIVGGAIPREFIGAVDKGCREQMEAGVIAGYPLVKVKVHYMTVLIMMLILAKSLLK